MPRLGGLTCGLAAAALAVSLVPAAASAAQAPAHGAGLARLVPGSLRVVGGGMAAVKSTNWGGYVDLASKGSTYSKVTANWTVPTLKCTSATAGGFASFWVGLDGFNDSTVEQTGIRAICETAKTAEYEDWWEMYPAGVEIVHSTLKAGDKLTGTVVVSGTKYTLSITDHTNPKNSLSVTKSCAKSTCTDATADWITESHVVTNDIPYPDYGTEAFTDASATSGKKTGTIGSFSNDAITIVDSSGKVNAAMSKLLDKGASFDAIWKRSN
jgi:Peptidase A4 family